MKMKILNMHQHHSLQETSKTFMVAVDTNIFSEPECLQSELSGGRHDESPSSGLPRVSLQLLKHGHEEGRGFSATSPRHRHHILSLQYERYCLCNI